MVAVILKFLLQLQPQHGQTTELKLIYQSESSSLSYHAMQPVCTIHLTISSLFGLLPSCTLPVANAVTRYVGYEQRGTVEAWGPACTLSLCNYLRTNDGGKEEASSQTAMFGMDFLRTALKQDSGTQGENCAALFPGHSHFLSLIACNMQLNHIWERPGNEVVHKTHKHMYSLVGLEQYSIFTQLVE